MVARAARALPFLFLLLLPSSPALPRPTDEAALIDQWIRANGLNRYGDPAGAMYTGGSPLFDERTAESIDRLTYLLKHHPDRPWMKEEERGGGGGGAGSRGSSNSQYRRKDEI